MIGKIPAYLTKTELAKMFKHLEQLVEDVIKDGNRHKIYYAYLWRAVTRMLYTTGQRNHEIRSLTYEDINIPQLRGIVFGKGDKYGAFTFSLAAQAKLVEYLHIRDTFFPGIAFRYLFTLYIKDKPKPLTEQKLNIELKEIAKQA